MEHTSSPDTQIRDLLQRMTLPEKIGQLQLVNGAGGTIPDDLRAAVASGSVGAVLNEVNPAVVHELQSIAVHDSRHGIPLLIGRDVIHGFATVFPIPLGQAASWNPEIVRRGARIAAREAAATGINWTFAPMVDIGRDPRWGRIAETLGEDPYLSGVLAAAMVRGFQGDDLSQPSSLAACAKHFAGYGASESGRDYNTTNIPEIDLRDIHLPSFKAACDVGVATFMTSFSDLNGIPATANDFLLKKILREEWGFDGFVVSDWESVSQLSIHGLTPDDRESAFEAAQAGLDMEMASTTFAAHLASLVEEGRIPAQRIDAMVENVLRIKFRLGLFSHRHEHTEDLSVIAHPDHLSAAKDAAVESMVLLKNDNNLLPLATTERTSIAVIGPLADDPYEQLGTWIFDGDERHSVTPLQSIRQAVPEDVTIHHARAMATTRSRDREGFDEALRCAADSDAVILFLGEESILSGEAHCRADIRLPGNQEELIREIAAIGKSVVLVIMAGRPLALENVIGSVDALLYAWHPGSMAGPAIADLLFGAAAPSGKLPVTFPRVTGQIPIYYAHKNTGKPAIPSEVMHIDDIPPRAPQVSFGLTSFHLDAGASPLFPFGFGLSYTTFRYDNIRTDTPEIQLGDRIVVTADLTNTGDREGTEIVQLYVRDLVGSVTRPVRELKAFKRVLLQPGEMQSVSFELHTDDLAFTNRHMQRVTEPGEFYAWIGGSSETELKARFMVR
mgnify:FL=1